MTDGCAVIFDLDGVLIDSYHVHLESWQQLAVENGITLTEEQFARWFGVTGRDLIRGLLAKDDPSCERIEALYARKTALYRDRFRLLGIRSGRTPSVGENSIILDGLE